jgi:hypothetical protein
MWLPDFARLCVLVLRFPDPSWPSFAVLNLLGPKFARCLPQVRALPAEVQDRGAVLRPGVPLPIVATATTS